MDVRCEKCMTVYEFDDSQVGEGGVTVKCTQCGNLFKVKRRSTTAEHALGAIAARSPAYIPPAASPPPAKPAPKPAPAQAAPKPAQAAPKPAPAPRPAPAPEPAPAPTRPTQPGWATATAPAQAKRSPTPARGQKRPPAPEPAAASEEDLALTTTAPMRQPQQQREFEGPMSMGDALLPDGDPAFASTARAPRITPPPHHVASTGRLNAIDDDDLAFPTRSRKPMIAIAAGAGVVVLLVLGVALRGRIFGGGDANRARDQLTQARNLFLLDTEDAFHQAAGMLEQAHGADEQNPLILAALGELDATWAGDLRDDAREIETKAGAAGEVATRSLRKSAQQHLDDAKRTTGDALALSPDLPEVNRAMAEFLRVDGAPMAEAERYLKRALDKRPNDAESLFAQGALLFREGRMDEARAKLEQANTAELGATQKPLFRALYFLGKLNAQTGKKDDARRALQQLTSLNPQHERGRALLASLEVAPAATPAPVAVVAVAPVAPVAPVPVAVAPPVGETPKKPSSSSDGDEPPAAGGDYRKLVAQADRLSENGHADQARKLYERALAANPRGVEALTGLGYCDLDGERFMTALDHFKQALNVVPEYGEALIGLAEAYKVKGDKVHAVDYYRRYLKSQPGGAKASMAQKNLKDLEPRLPPPEAAPPPAKDDEPVKNEAPPEKKPAAEEKAEKTEKTELPHLPQAPPADEPNP